MVRRRCGGSTGSEAAIEGEKVEVGRTGREECVMSGFTLRPSSTNRNALGQRNAFRHILYCKKLSLSRGAGKVSWPNLLPS